MTDPKDSWINVFFTSTNRIRARVTNKATGIATEVTVGGKAWGYGKLEPYHDRIIKKALRKAECMVTFIKNLEPKETI